jgi:hypothetical protein
MATIGKGTSINPDDNVAVMLKNLNLTAEEEEVAEFSGDEEGDDSPMVEWALVGKVLSPTMVHAAAIQGAMKPAWGNPAGLKIRMIEKKGDKSFSCGVRLQVGHGESSRWFSMAGGEARGDPARL